jgi:potassium/hydrogen antiporter
VAAEIPSDRTDNGEPIITGSLTNFFGLLGALLVLAFVANRLAKWTRVPDVIVLLVTGIVLGPVLHWIDGSKFTEMTRGFGTLALILILFAAGLELDLRNALKQFGAGTVLALLSYSLSLVGVTYFCMYALHMALMPSLLVGATLACMSGSVILPVLEQLDMRQAVRTTLVIEASFGDGLGALGVGVLIDLAHGGGEIKAGPLPDLLARVGLAPGSHGSIAGAVTALLLFKFLLALATAIVAGFLWLRLLPLISDKQFWQVLTFGAVLLLYAGTHAIGGTALFAVMAFGAALANLPDPRHSADKFVFRILPPDPSKAIHSFHAELAFLVRSFFFVLLGVLVDFGGLRKEIVASLGITGVLFLARAIAVQMSRVAWRGTSRLEREVATLLIPRGLITAVLALDAVRAMPVELAFLTPLAFAVLLLTNFLVLVAAVRAKDLVLEAPPSVVVVEVTGVTPP